jgi:FkbM family methyltransferase
VVFHHRRDEGGFEPQTRAAWARLVKPGEVALDVGAYTGLYAIAAAKLGAEAIAMEPVRVNTARMRENMRINGVQVAIYCLAASDEPGRQVMMFAPGVSPLPSGGKIARQSKGTLVETATTTRIDDLPFKSLAAVKLDVEKHELQALKGARAMLARFRPAIICETLDQEAVGRACGHLSSYRLESILDGRNLLLMPDEAR